jgi:hypothetical protein
VYSYFLTTILPICNTMTCACLNIEMVVAQCLCQSSPAKAGDLASCAAEMLPTAAGTGQYNNAHMYVQPQIRHARAESPLTCVALSQ